MPLDLVILRPGKDGIRGEFGAVIGDNHSGLATPLDQRRQFAGDKTAGDRGVRDRRQAFARHVIGDIEDAKASAAGELSTDLRTLVLPITHTPPSDAGSPYVLNAQSKSAKTHLNRWVPGNNGQT
ncbi:hypothetical protein JL39_11105 [Rhizobium sp. YS-1r]|nr:hypothetical protein JL39_11105 [Rhizobium sp. YS-1r]